MLNSESAKEPPRLKIDHTNIEKSEVTEQIISKTKKFSIIIPAFNEENRIRPVLEDIVDYLNINGLNWDIILSIDGNDGTEEVAKEYLPKYSNIKILRSPGRSGKGGSVKRAIGILDSDYVILMDADNSIPFSTIIENLKSTNNFDLIIFSRYNSSMNDIPFIRRVISRGFNRLLRMTLRINIKDTQSGYKIIKTEPFIEAMGKVSVTNTFFDVAMLYHLLRKRVKVKEIEVDYQHKDGSKFHPVGEVIGQGTSLLAFRIRYSRFYKYIPDKLIQLYYRKFRWI